MQFGLFFWPRVFSFYLFNVMINEHLQEVVFSFSKKNVLKRLDSLIFCNHNVYDCIFLIMMLRRTLFFRAKENEEHLHLERIKDKSKLFLLEDGASKDRKHNVMLKAIEAIAGVREEVANCLRW